MFRGTPCHWSPLTSSVLCGTGPRPAPWGSPSALCLLLALCRRPSPTRHRPPLSTTPPTQYAGGHHILYTNPKLVLRPKYFSYLLLDCLKYITSPNTPIASAANCLPPLLPLRRRPPLSPLFAAPRGTFGVLDMPLCPPRLPTAIPPTKPQARRILDRAAST